MSEYKQAEAGFSPTEPDLGTTRAITVDGAASHIGAHDQLERGLKSRHIQFMALGGAIGTGLFVGSGAILATVGPAPLFMGYMSMMLIVYCVMNSLGELATYLPMKGITIPYFVDRFVDPSLGFAAGWNYWYAYAMLVGAEASAGSILLEYWDTPVPTAVWITIILLVILGLNIFAVGIFGEAEFWFASIKLITLLGLIICSIVIICGGAPNDKATGFWYWEDPGAFISYPNDQVSESTGRFLGYWHGFVQAGFAFITSPELIALAAGETVAPRRNIPKAARRFTYRLAFFYGVTSLLVGTIVPSSDDHLLKAASNGNASPWVIGIQRAGIGGLRHAVNAAILTSAWSAGNAFLYSGSRILYTLALNGQAPKVLGVTNRNGVPYLAVLVTWAISLLTYLNVNNDGAVVFGWFVNISTISGYIAWIVVLITYLRFRRGLDFRGLLHTRPFQTPFQPWASYATLFLLVVLTLTNGFQAFFPGNFSASSFLSAYITLPVFVALYLGHKIFFRTPFMRKPEDIDVVTGKPEMDALEALDERPIPRNWLEKAWFWLA